MDQNQDKALFPGQKRGVIRVLIKREESEVAVQLRIGFNGELESIQNKPLFTSKKKRLKNTTTNSEQQQVDSDQLTFDLFESDTES